ncbi:hypothetical protein HYV49_05920 [Candidatus Pacearchaeota archaeon]|nr:hypothetical protein [Candidatus Pacearchaeota archaeon]
MKTKMSDKKVMEFAGVWKEINDKNIKDIKKSIKNLRKNATKKLMDIYSNIEKD